MDLPTSFESDAGCGYCPAWVLHTLAQAPYPIRAFEHALDGIALSIDISGFTKLTHEASQKGIRDVENLFHDVTSWLSAIESIVESAGGEVVAMAGDSVLAVWRTIHHGSIEKCRQMLEVATGEILSKHAHADGGSTFRFRLGAAAGSVVLRAIHCANNGWRHFVHGSAVRDAISNQQKARPNASPEVSSSSPHSDVSNLTWISAAHSNGWPPDFSTRAAAIYQHHVLHLQEIRLVWVLFVSVEVPQKALLSLSEIIGFADVVAACSSRTEAELIRIGEDEKGLYAFLSWGTPGSAHEDDLQRSLATALQLHADLSGAGFEIRIGLSRGLGACGVMRGRSWGEYGVYGACVNEAAHFLRLPAGEIVCPADWSAELIEADAGFRPLERGIALAIDPANAPPGADAKRPRALSPSSALAPIGRDQLLHKVNESIDDFFSNRSSQRFCVLTGEAGIGKSAFLKAVISAPRSIRLNTTTLTGFESSASTPLAAWKAYAEARVKDAFQDGCPNLMVVEDFHWLDSLSIDALRQESLEQGMTYVLLASRDSLRDRARLDTLLRWFDPAPLHIDLRRLDFAQTAKLIQQRLGCESCSERLKVKAFNLSQGTPLHVCALADDWRNKGEVVIKERHAELRTEAGGGLENHLPVGLTALLQAQIDCLPPSELRLLKAGSILGNVFTLEDISILSPDDAKPNTASGFLESAKANGFIQELEGTLGQYQFTHALIRQATYGLVPPSQRDIYHRSIASRFEDAKDFSDILLPVIAQHWLKTNDDIQAAESALKAAEYLLQSNAAFEAADLFEQVLKKTETVQLPGWGFKRAQAMAGLGMALNFIGDRERAASVLAKSLLMLRQPIYPSGSPMQIVHGLATVCKLIPDFLSLQRKKQFKGMGATEMTSGRDQLVSMSMFRFANISWFMNQTGYLRYIALVSLEQSLQGGASEAAARIAQSLAVGIPVLSGSGVARLYSLGAWKMVRHSQNPTIHAEMWLYRALDCLGQGKLPKAKWLLNRATSWASRGIELQKSEEVAVSAAFVDLHLGNLDHARSQFQQCLDMGRRRGVENTVCWGELGLARLEMMAWNFEAARLHLDRAQLLRVDSLSEIELLGLGSMIRFNLGQTTEALRLAEACVRLCGTGGGPNFSVINGLACGIMVLHQSLETGIPLVQVHYARGVKIFQKLAKHYQLAQVAAHLMDVRSTRLSGTQQKAQWHKVAELSKCTGQSIEHSIAVDMLAGQADTYEERRRVVPPFLAMRR